MWHKSKTYFVSLALRCVRIKAPATVIINTTLSFKVLTPHRTESVNQQRCHGRDRSAPAQLAAAGRDIMPCNAIPRQQTYELQSNNNTCSSNSTKCVPFSSQTDIFSFYPASSVQCPSEQHLMYTKASLNTSIMKAHRAYLWLRNHKKQLKKICILRTWLLDEMIKTLSQKDVPNILPSGW